MVRVFFAAVLGIGLLGAIAPSEALAQQPCGAEINGVPATGETISVSQDSEATVAIASGDAATRGTLSIDFLGKHEVDSVQNPPSTWQADVPIDDWAIWGTGLYKVAWVTVDAQGDVLCAGSATIKVDGFPLFSVAGAAGTGALVIGLIGLTFSARATINAAGRWALKISGSGEVKSDEKEKLRFKLSFSFAQTLLSTLWGILLTGGTWALLWTTATSLPTIELSFSLFIPFALFSFLFSSLQLQWERQ